MWHVTIVLNWAFFAFAAFVLTRTLAGAVSKRLGIGIAICAAVSGLELLKTAIGAVRHIGEWDFLCFWLYGRAAVSHANVYAPATYHAMLLPIATGADFRPEVLDVGFPYPPAAIWFMAPLGLTNIHVASALWMVAILTALIVAIVVLAKPIGWSGGAALATLAFTLPATGITISLQQTNFFALLAVVVAATAAARSGLVAGIAAGVAAIVKPYLAVVPLWLALRRRWSAFVASVVTVSLATVAAIPLLGPGGLTSFMHANPATRMPASVFREPNNASLYAALLRHGGAMGSYSGALHDPIFLTIAGLLGLGTLVLAITASSEDGDLALGLLVAFGLIAYPGSGEAYAIVLLPAALALCKRLTPEQAAFAALGATVFFAGNITGGDGTLFAEVFIWLALGATLIAERRAYALRTIAPA